MQESTRLLLLRRMKAWAEAERDPDQVRLMVYGFEYSPRDMVRAFENPDTPAGKVLVDLYDSMIKNHGLVRVLEGLYPRNSKEPPMLY